MSDFIKGKIEVLIEKCRDNAIIPAYAREGDAGLDVCSAQDADIYPGQTKIISTGLKLATPIGYEIQVRPRSGLSHKTLLRIANSPGTIDSGFRDELGIIISNTGVDIEWLRSLCEACARSRREGHDGGDKPYSNGDKPNSDGDKHYSNGDKPNSDGDKHYRAGDMPYSGGDKPYGGGDSESSTKLQVYELSDPFLSDSVKKPCIYRIKAGDRIAQIVLSLAPSVEFVVVDSVADIGKNRGGGFGSSGV
ncbi:MAG: hypothetical protein FWH55_07275 [Oscillospiraceae bacterium]|nr:hypothetical protein [Oscillospiraceae bacterium]